MGSQLKEKLNEIQIWNLTLVSPPPNTLNDTSIEPCWLSEYIAPKKKTSDIHSRVLATTFFFFIITIIYIIY